MLYDIFLLYIRDIYMLKNQTRDWKSLEKTQMWEYLLSCFNEHILWIEALLKAWYYPDDCYFNDVLSWEFPIIYLNEQDNFLESINSYTELIPKVTFTLPNKFWDENISYSRFLKVAFSKGWMAWVD